MYSKIETYEDLAGYYESLPEGLSLWLQVFSSCLGNDKCVVLAEENGDRNKTNLRPK